jgi:uncharacterized DUF497 family protein
MEGKFEWDANNIEHIARHNVLPPEAEQAIMNKPIDLTRELRSGEVRIRQLGITNAGRILIVLSTMVEKRIRVVTAHDASRRLRAYYLTIRR